MRKELSVGRMVVIDKIRLPLYIAIGMTVQV
jgi:hypothetical protein